MTAVGKDKDKQDFRHYPQPQTNLIYPHIRIKSESFRSSLNLRNVGI